MNMITVHVHVQVFKSLAVTRLCMASDPLNFQGWKRYANYLLRSSRLLNYALSAANLRHKFRENGAIRQQEDNERKIVAAGMAAFHSSFISSAPIHIIFVTSWTEWLMVFKMGSFEEILVLLLKLLGRHNAMCDPRRPHIAENNSTLKFSSQTNFFLHSASPFLWKDQLSLPPLARL